VISISLGIWLWLWYRDPRKWFWVCSDYSWSSEWKHPGWLCGVLSAAWPGKTILYFL